MLVCAHCGSGSIIPTPELEAAYLIDKALEEKADDIYQSGSGRIGA